METYKKIKADIAAILMIWLMIIVALELFEYGYDSTDGDSRSGMSLHVDSMTGCHYLGRRGLTPRLDRSGTHICSGSE